MLKVLFSCVIIVAEFIQHSVFSSSFKKDPEISLMLSDQEDDKINQRFSIVQHFVITSSTNRIIAHV
jgi:hypothetical protein